MINIKSINRYIIKEYINSILIVTAVMLSLILLMNLSDEFAFFKSKKDLKFFIFLTLTALKIPNTFINLFPFIILFSGIIFYIKIYNYNEIISLRIMGYSNIQIILIPALTSFVIGYFIIFFLVPFSSSLLKSYENIKSEYNETKNLIFVNETGIWVLDKKEKEKNIIRIKSINKDFTEIYDITIYNYNDDNFIKRIDSKYGFINKKTWELNEGSVIDVKKKNKEENFKKFIYETDINIIQLRNTYKNTETTSLLDIQTEIQLLMDKGYSVVDLRIRFQKLLSYPLYLLSMSILSGLMIINLGKTSNYLKYGIYGILISITIYFLNDLSITIAKSGIISVDFSVWIPIFLIILINLIGITQVNAK